MTKIPVSELPVIGWREWLSLPELGVAKIKAKIDTGARTSSLHAFNIRFYKKGSKSIVKFKVHPIQKDHQTTVDCSAEIIDRRKIKSSNGHTEIRPIIRTLVDIMGTTHYIEVSLTSRDVMGFRMLLGREAIRGRYNVASGVSFVDKRLLPIKKKKRKIRKKPINLKKKMKNHKESQK